MKVYVENHYSAALVTDLETNKTLLVQSENDQIHMFGKEWDEGVYDIADEYLDYFDN